MRADTSALSIVGWTLAACHWTHGEENICKMVARDRWHISKRFLWHFLLSYILFLPTINFNRSLPNRLFLFNTSIRKR